MPAFGYQNLLRSLGLADDRPSVDSLYGRDPSMDLPMGGGTRPGAVYPVGPTRAPVQQTGGGFFDSLLDDRGNPGGLAMLGSALMGPNSQIGAAIQQGAKLRAFNDQRSALAKYLVRKGIAQDEEEGFALASDPDLLNKMTGHDSSRPASIEEYEYGLAHPDYVEAQKRNQRMRSSLGQPVILEVPDGRGGMVKKPFQVTDEGLREMDMPEGGRYYDPATKAYDTRAAQNNADLATQIPGAEISADLIDTQINDLINDPYLPNMLGAVSNSGGYLTRNKLPNLTPEANRVQSKMDQLQGGAFLQARTLLAHSGPITDWESKRAEAAYARLNSAQNYDDYVAALGEFRSAIKAGLKKLYAARQQRDATGLGQGAPDTTGVGGNWDVQEVPR